VLSQLQETPPPSIIVTVASEPAHETTLGEVIFGSLGVVAVLVLLAIVLGGVMSLLLVAWHRRHRPEDDHLPPVVPGL
jgi:hypothetical protein